MQPLSSFLMATGRSSMYLLPRLNGFPLNLSVSSLINTACCPLPLPYPSQSSLPSPNHNSTQFPVCISCACGPDLMWEAVVTPRALSWWTSENGSSLSGFRCFNEEEDWWSWETANELIALHGGAWWGMFKNHRDMQLLGKWTNLMIHFVLKYLTNRTMYRTKVLAGTFTCSDFSFLLQLFCLLLPWLRSKLVPFSSLKQGHVFLLSCWRNFCAIP